MKRGDKRRPPLFFFVPDHNEAHYLMFLCLRVLLRRWETKFCKFAAFLLFLSVVHHLSAGSHADRGLMDREEQTGSSYSKSPPALVLESSFICCRLPLLPPFPTNPPKSDIVPLNITHILSAQKREKNKSLWRRRGSVR